MTLPVSAAPAKQIIHGVRRRVQSLAIRRRITNDALIEEYGITRRSFGRAANLKFQPRRSTRAAMTRLLTEAGCPEPEIREFFQHIYQLN